MALALPTRRDESWRYSDLEAVASVWPVPAPERIEVAAGGEIARVIVQDAAPDVVAIHDYAVVLGAGA
ncbi:MAG: SufD family Fe-S cluster assembly protein, partial [Novosphingobium sp.]|nr:SufD family Fe-S cluster assembly protein [Novosphingobium sp.]